MTRLEIEIAELYRQLANLAERVRLDATAERFGGPDEIREGDCFLLHGEPYQLNNISSDGRWTYGSREWHDIPADAKRLYTREEVVAIMSKARE